MLSTELKNSTIDLINSANRLVLSWPTGVGKGYFSVQLINLLKPKKCLILVSEKLHKKNWLEEFNKNKVSYVGVTIECYASLKKVQNTDWDLLILDEFHHAGSDLRLDYLKSVKANKILCLSATVNESTLIYLQQIYGNFKIHNISLSKAINDNLIPRPKIILIPLKLNTIEKSEIIIKSWGKQSLRKIINTDVKGAWIYRKNKKLYPNVELHISCTEYEKYKWLCDQYNYYKKQMAITHNKRSELLCLQWGTKRKTFLGLLKTQIVKEFLPNLDKRYICFCTNIDQAIELGGDRAIHSKNKDNSKIIDKFNNEEINSIFAVEMATEGQNFKNIEAGIIIQLDGNKRMPIQKTGRVLRSKEPIQYIFYYQNTRDEEFLKSFLQNVDANYVYTLDKDGNTFKY